MIICPVNDISSVRMIKCLEKTNFNVLFSLEQSVDIELFKDLTKNIKNKEIIVNILKPSVYNNIYFAINHILKHIKNYSEYFTILDIDDEIKDDFERYFNEFVNILKLRNCKLGRFLGPELRFININNSKNDINSTLENNSKDNFEENCDNAIKDYEKRIIINPREYGYYYSTIFHISIFENLPPLTFINPIHADNFLVGYALEHTDNMLWLPKYFGYIHYKAISNIALNDASKTSTLEAINKSNLEASNESTLKESINVDSNVASKSTDSNTISKDRLEDTLYMYCLQSFSFKHECYEIPKLTITIATMTSRINKLKQTLFNLSQIRAIKNKIAKVVINCADKNYIIESLCKYYNFEFRFAKDNQGSFNKLNLTESEKNGFVLTLDDDYIYDNNIIEKLLKSYILYNRNVVVAGEVRELNIDSTSKNNINSISETYKNHSKNDIKDNIEKSTLKAIEKTTLKESNNVDSKKTIKELSYEKCIKTSKTNNFYNSVIGGSGVLYPPNFFNNVIERDINIFKTCDDLYFTLIAFSKNISIKTSKYALNNKSLGLDNDSLYEKAKNNNFDEYNKALSYILTSISL